MVYSKECKESDVLSPFLESMPSKNLCLKFLEIFTLILLTKFQANINLHGRSIVHGLPQKLNTDRSCTIDMMLISVTVGHYVAVGVLAVGSCGRRSVCILIYSKTNSNHHA